MAVENMQLCFEDSKIAIIDVVWLPQAGNNRISVEIIHMTRGKKSLLLDLRDMLSYNN